MGRLLIDGYNVIRRDPQLRALESRDPLAARSELIRLLHHNSVSRYQVIVVFDGTPPPAERKPPRGVKLIHSRGQTADELIAGLSGSGDIVVTDDRGLAADTLPAGPRLWSVEKLLNTVRPHGKAGRRTENVTEQPPILNPPGCAALTYVPVASSTSATTGRCSVRRTAASEAPATFGSNGDPQRTCRDVACYVSS